MSDNNRRAKFYRLWAIGRRELEREVALLDACRRRGDPGHAGCLMKARDRGLTASGSVSPALVAPARGSRRDIDDELAFHLAMREAEHAHARGGRAARRRGGSSATWPSSKEQVHDMWTFPSFESIWRDVRYALRTLRRTPGVHASSRVLVLASASAPTPRCSASSTRWCCAACRIPTPIGWWC